MLGTPELADDGYFKSTDQQCFSFCVCLTETYTQINRDFFSAWKSP